MRNGWLIGLFCILVLCACSQQATLQPGATPTILKPPVVTIQKLVSTPTPTQFEVAPTQLPGETSTASAASAPVEPTASPTTLSAQASATETPVQPTPTAVPTLVTPTTAPTEAPTPAQPGGEPQTAAGCIDKAAYYGDITAPDITPFKQGTPFTKTWQIRNVGTCVWDGYHLVSAGGDIMNGKQSNPMPVVQPGETANISVDLKSPAQGGLYTGLWEFENKAGQRFGVNSGGGDLIWVKISVSWYDVNGNTTAISADTGAPVTVANTACAYRPNADYVQQLLKLVNQARAEIKLKALTLRSGLSAAALAHSVDMACNNFVDHTGSDGSTWTTRIQVQNYKYSYASENIYSGDPAFNGDAAGAFDWWMHSQVHRDNILSPKVTSIGIGYAYFGGSDYKGYYTLDFARP